MSGGREKDVEFHVNITMVATSDAGQESWNRRCEKEDI